MVTKDQRDKLSALLCFESITGRLIFKVVLIFHLSKWSGVIYLTCLRAYSIVQALDFLLSHCGLQVLICKMFAPKDTYSENYNNELLCA